MKVTLTGTFLMTDLEFARFCQSYPQAILTENKNPVLGGLVCTNFLEAWAEANKDNTAEIRPGPKNTGHNVSETFHAPGQPPRKSIKLNSSSERVLEPVLDVSGEPAPEPMKHDSDGTSLPIVAEEDSSSDLEKVGKPGRSLLDRLHALKRS